jgi:branched-chain amino acid transport system permease protein
MKLRRAFLIAFVLLLAAMPQAPVPEFWITQANYIGLYTLVAIGLVVSTRVSGIKKFVQSS